MIEKEEAIVEENNFFNDLKFRYIPYWPLFAVLLLLFLALAFVYVNYKVPVYEISASLMINDEQKGGGDPQTIRALNVYASNKVVENEVQVLQSRALVNEVVNNLHLYAPIFEKGHVRPASAFLTSPIIVEAKNPEQLKEQKEINFEYDYTAASVKIDRKHFPLNQWFTFPYGTIRFILNPYKSNTTERPLYFSIIHPRNFTNGILHNLDVAVVSKLSSVVTINYTDEVPERGERIVNELLEAYIRGAVLNNNQLAASTLTFVEERIRDVEHELDSIERRVQQFKAGQGIIDLSEQGRIYLQNVAENDRKAADLNIQLAVLNQVENYVRSGSSRTGIIPTTLGIDDPVLANLLQRLNQLELEYSNLRTTTPENNSIVRSLENEIRKIRPNILNIVRNQRSRLLASRSNLNNTTQRFSAQLRTIPGKERALLEISRQQTIKNDVYSFLLQRREEAALSSASTIPDSRIVDKAEASIYPVGSGKLIALAAAFAAAFGLAIVYVFIKEGLTGKTLFRSEIDKLTTLPVITEIVYRRFRSKSLKQSASDIILSKELSQLQVALGLFTNGTKKKKLLVTSSLLKEGKTFISNHLAISLAATGKLVVIIDLNLYNPTTSSLHQLQEEKGFTDFILDYNDVQHLVQKTEFPNLNIIPAGSRNDNPVALLLNSRTEEILHFLETHYDYIIIDSPPIELATDAFTISKYCDSTLFIVRHEVTPKAIVQKLDDNIRLRSLPDVNIIFNGVKARGYGKRYYGYGYGYGYENVFNKKYYLHSG